MDGSSIVKSCVLVGEILESMGGRERGRVALALGTRPGRSTTTEFIGRYGSSPGGGGGRDRFCM